MTEGAANALADALVKASDEGTFFGASNYGSSDKSVGEILGYR
jgi:hypothetical protein